MRGAYGKPYGVVARVEIGQVLLSVRCKDANRAVVIEALRRARYKVRCYSGTIRKSALTDLVLFSSLVSKRSSFPRSGVSLLSREKNTSS